MKTCYTLLVVASLLGSCATERVPLAIDAKVDSALVAAGLSPLSVRKVKFTGPVTFQVGGSHNTATAIEKAKAPLASGPHATAMATLTGGSPWYVYGGLAALAVGAGFYLRGKIALPF